MLKTYKSKEPNRVMEKTEEQELPLIVQQKRFLEYILNPNRGEEFIYADPAFYFEEQPKEFRDRVFYLCLRGLREGILQIAEIYKVTDPLKIASVDGMDYEEKTYDASKKRNIKTGRKSDPIQECVKKRLIADTVVNKYLAWKNSQKLFESNCEDIAIGVSTHYANLVKQEELKRLHII